MSLDVGPETTKATRARVLVGSLKLEAQVVTALRQAGIGVVERAGAHPPEPVTIAVAATIDAALDLSGTTPALVLAEQLSPGGLRRALRTGVRAILPLTGLDAQRLGAAVRAAGHGDARIPYDVLVRLWSRQRPGTATSTLTPRQTTVLALMAEGHGNAAIARALSCSEHTIKNVIYEMMGRLQARNRAHAVACAVRAELI
ncbi:response regulator transcription factor [Actinoplanes sp. NPDC049118]|uniref:helix-turn-helix transcriptional regulator n=1 Tax=Actinoplanes sp. NPDC049118 TaxID=3155769 RepID=UPI00340CB81D